MKVVLQRVTRARVEVKDEVVGQIDQGLLVFVGITYSDTQKEADILIDKILKLRIFEDPSADSGQAGKMNLSVADANGGLLVVSQFTLYADTKKGTRPSFGDAAPPDMAKDLYEYVVRRCAASGLRTETGRFGAHMMIDFVNDGPVTIILES